MTERPTSRSQVTSNIDHSPSPVVGRPRRRRLVRRGRRALATGLLVAALGLVLTGASAIASGVLVIVGAVVVIVGSVTVLAGLYATEAATDVRPGGGFSTFDV